jgi:PilZ domain
MEPQLNAPEQHPAGQATIDERRASVRFPCDLETSCQPIAERTGDAWPARVLDLSAGGVALELSRRFERGAMLSVRLESPDGETSRTLFVRVVHATAQLDGSWRLGCALAGELGQEELQAFQAAPVRPNEPDCRAWVRFACDVEAPCQALAPARPGTWSARIVDVSPGGMSLLLPDQFERGTLLSIELPVSKPGQPKQVMLRVLRSRPLGSHLWELGCELADHLSDADLQRFQ